VPKAAFCSVHVHVRPRRSIVADLEEGGPKSRRRALPERVWTGQRQKTGVYSRGLLPLPRVLREIRGNLLSVARDGDLEYVKILPPVSMDTGSRGLIAARGQQESSCIADTNQRHRGYDDGETDMNLPDFLLRVKNHAGFEIQPTA